MEKLEISVESAEDLKLTPALMPAANSQAPAQKRGSGGGGLVVVVGVGEKTRTAE